MRPMISVRIEMERGREARPLWSRCLRLRGWPEVLGALGVILVAFFW